ncbi:MAG: HAMP domain-containing histidine kinase [Lachnospiraceae bacterium]|nr:HAMP domain-containing histidine kinase [Lachnospiraceae bacterium]
MGSGDSKKKNKRKHKFPIRVQFSLIFIACMAGILALCIFANTVLLERFYQNEKLTIIKDAYKMVYELVDDSAYKGTEQEKELDEISVVNNVSIIIVDSGSETLYVSMNCERDMEFVLLGYIFGKESQIENVDVIEKNDDYTIRKVFGNGQDYIEMVGRFSEGVSFLMRIPMSNIEESAAVANRFFIYVCVLGAVVGAIVIRVVTKRLTKPIEELNSISEKMVNLDFNARYTGHHVNEIGVLGDNMNKLSESLEHSISELKTANIELQKDIKKKEELDKLRQEFIANVSHELKTPLAIIQGYAEGLKDGISDDPESMQYYCEVIIDEAGKMNNMVKQFLNLNQLEYGSDKTVMERFDITALVRNYIESAGMLAKQDDIKIIFECDEDIFAWGDEYKAEEVLTNYFSNAVHYCQADINGEKYIKIDIHRTDNRIRISVFNTGSPIPEDSLPRLWDKFYKVDKARTREYGGSGVGLSIVKAIQENMRMGYGVENKESGVVFWYELEGSEYAN